MKRKCIALLSVLSAVLALLLIAGSVGAEVGDFGVSGGFKPKDDGTGNVVFDLKVENNTGTDIEDAVVIAVTYADGVIYRVGYQTVSVGGNSTASVTVETDVCGGAADGKGNIKHAVMLWEGFDTMKPLAKTADMTDNLVTPTPEPYTAFGDFEPSSELLVNPHIGFMTFASYNGAGYFNWNGYFPETVYTGFDGNLENPNYVDTSIAYIRVYWRFIEPYQGEYDWALVDRLLRLAEQRGQTLMFRIMVTDGHTDSSQDQFDAEEHNDNCAPAWFRAIPGIFDDNPDPVQWGFNHNHPAFYENFSRLIRAFAERYDGHRNLDSIDIAYAGHCGENIGTEKLDDEVMEKLVKVYVDSFNTTPLIGFLTDHGNESTPMDNKNMNHYVINNGGKAGLRADSFGDMGFYSGNFNWNYMMGSAGSGFNGGKPNSGYPWAIDRANKRAKEVYGKEVWELGTVSFETCWAFQNMYEEHTYTKPHYDPDNPGADGQHRYDIDLIIDKANEWHTSSINGKSSPIPEEWRPIFYEWLKQMGYRFSLHKTAYTDSVDKNGELAVKTVWHNLGVAPIYHPWYELAYRLTGPGGTHIFISGADIKEWMPGKWVAGTHKWNSRAYSDFDPEIPAYKFTLDEPGYLEPSPDWKAEDTFALDGAVAPGTYRLQVAIVSGYSKNPDYPENGEPVKASVPANVPIDDSLKEPAIIIANGELDGDGVNLDRDGDGWFTVGTVTVK